jgi:ActR/RegA family two-component response regulator
MGSIRRVLVLEDNEQVVAAYMRLLKQVSCVQTLAATTIATARTFIGVHCLHLAVIDRLLPDGDGIDFLAEIRARDTNVRLLVVSGQNDTSSSVRAMRAGADDVIDKPISRRTLERYLNAIELPSSEDSPTLDLAMWQYVQRVFKDNQLNKSQTARRLGVDRNTLKRWLGRPPPRT